MKPLPLAYKKEVNKFGKNMISLEKSRINDRDWYLGLDRGFFTLSELEVLELIEQCRLANKKIHEK